MLVGTWHMLVAFGVMTEAYVFRWHVQDREVMDKAIDVHDHVVRTQVARFNGYEISTEGDAFTIAFHDAADAVAWSIATQQVSIWSFASCC